MPPPHTYTHVHAIIGESPGLPQVVALKLPNELCHAEETRRWLEEKVVEEEDREKEEEEGEEGDA